MKNVFISLKKQLIDIYKTLYPFKWYICFYLLFYSILIIFYLSPSCKHYFFWNNESWYQFSVPLYLAGMRLVLIIFMLLFFLGLSSIKNHPILAKIIFLSSFYFSALFLDIF